jgi:hypothetical protein
MTAHRSKTLLLGIIVPAREAGLSFEQIARQLALSGERVRQLWRLHQSCQPSQLSPVDAKPEIVDADGSPATSIESEEDERDPEDESISSYFSRDRDDVVPRRCKWDAIHRGKK